MKIAIINNLYKPYHKGGAERVCESLIKDLENAGHSCFVISTKPKDKTEINNEPLTYYLPSEYYNLSNKSLPYRLLWQIANLFNFNQGQKLKNILLSEKPDLVITNNLMGIGLQTFRIIKKLGIKQQHILHDVQLFYPSGLIIFGQEKKANSLLAKTYQAIVKHIIGSPDTVISPSQWLLREHLKRGYFKNSLKKVQPNPVKIEKAEIEKKENKEMIDFLFVGQLEKHKGIIFLINTFKQIDRDDIKLKIIGSGTLEKEIKELINNDNRFEFLSRKESSELAKELQKSDCLIVPSLCYENSPTIIYEAKNFGLPIIASDLGGIPELINRPQERLFKPGDKADLMIKIEEFTKKSI